MFLFINNYWLNVGHNFLYALAIKVAKSEIKDMDEVKKMIAKKIKKNLSHLSIVGDDKSHKTTGFMFQFDNFLKNFLGRK